MKDELITKDLLNYTIIIPKNELNLKYLVNKAKKYVNSSIFTKFDKNYYGLIRIRQKHGKYQQERTRIKTSRRT